MSSIEADNTGLAASDAAPPPIVQKRRAARKTRSANKSAKKRSVRGAKKSSVKQVLKPKEKDKKPKLIRDSFTIPEDEYQVLVAAKKRIVKSGLEVRKTEIVRIGLALVGKASLAELKKQLGALKKLQSGRPKRK